MLTYYVTYSQNKYFLNRLLIMISLSFFCQCVQILPIRAQFLIDRNVFCKHTECLDIFTSTLVDIVNSSCFSITSHIKNNKVLYKKITSHMKNKKVLMKKIIIFHSSVIQMVALISTGHFDVTLSHGVGQQLYGRRGQPPLAGIT
jgi:hypothetical protein